ncbi:O-antigen polysaccharide polymerase Wzy [Moheibacter sediminis]|uniref:Oligosaccharide repeat unit polymerase n=1 Tax=Moheibacter sediminis TaxID=1434700 RepID=A0A1W2BAE9_9FLAO|nr:O-antigen polysaccharide polymerase Wzy [Moheibacter sediminis]SMC69889.1 oligosaccharide repeat unit polymerase [Moheibacter sediminis]
MFKKLLFFGIVLLLSVYYFNSNENMDKEVIFILLSLVGVTTFLFFYRKEAEPNLKGQFFKHSTIAVTGLLIVNFQYYIDYLVGNIPITDSFIFVNQRIVVKSLTLSLIGLLMFFIGYLSYTKRKKIFKARKRIYHTKYLEILVVVFLILYFSTININYVMGGYGKVDKGSGITYIDLLFKTFVISTIIQKTRNLILSGKENITIKIYLKNLGLPLNISLILYLLTVLLSGDRGPLITFLILVFTGYLFVTKRKVKKRYGILALFVGASLITILGVARSFSSDLSFTDKVQLAFQDDPFSQEKSFLPQTKELAGSVKANHHAVDFVPEHHDFLYGRFQFQQITVVLPFFNIFNVIIFEDVSKKYAGSASFVTWIFQGDRPTYGNGTSVIADFYFDLGLIGVVIGMFFFGYFMRMAEVKMYVEKMPSLFSHTFFMVYIGSALYIARSSFLFEFRTVVWVFVILLINQYLFNKKYL